MNNFCPISNRPIKNKDCWTLKSSDGKYSMIVSIIGENIIRLKNNGYTSLLVSHEIHPQVESIIKSEFDNKPYFIIYDYKDFKGINTKVRNNYIKWVKSNSEQIKGVYFYNTSAFTKILVKTSKILLKHNIHIYNNYEETITAILRLENSSKKQIINPKDNTKKYCPYSNYEITAPESWIFKADNGKYRLEVSIIDNNILHVKNIGFATIEITKTVWPLMFSIYDREIKGNKFYLVHDYSNYQGASSEVRLNYIKWIKKHSADILGIYVYGASTLTSTLLKTGILLLKGLDNLIINSDYEETILAIQNNKNNTLVNDFIIDENKEWEINTIISIVNKQTYTVKKIWTKTFEAVTIYTYLINNNIFIRRYKGNLTEKHILVTQDNFKNILKETQLQKYHFYTQFSDDATLSLKYRKYGADWFNNNYTNILTAAFFNLSFINRIGIQISKTFVFHTKFKKRVFILNNLKESITTIHKYNSGELQKHFEINEYKNKSKKELIQIIENSKTKNKELIKTQTQEIEQLYYKLGRLSWDEDFNYNHIDIDRRNSPFSDLNNAIVLIQEDIKDLMNRKDYITQKAQESDRLKSSFLANMSHEIRTPLNSILGFSNLLLEKANHPQLVEKYSRIIIKSGKNLLNLINDIIDISKIESNQLDIIKKPFIVNEMIENTYQLFKNNNKLIEQKISLELENSIDSNLTINSDELRIEQILNNLINNAIKFTEEGSIKIISKFADNFLSIIIEDTGIGIDEKKQNLIFDRFRQENINTSQYYGGSGLGLSISRSLAQMLGGDIFLKSQKGKGSQFELKLGISNYNNNSSKDYSNEEL